MFHRENWNNSNCIVLLTRSHQNSHPSMYYNLAANQKKLLILFPRWFSTKTPLINISPEHRWSTERKQTEGAKSFNCDFPMTLDEQTLIKSSKSFGKIPLIWHARMIFESRSLKWQLGISGCHLKDLASSKSWFFFGSWRGKISLKFDTCEVIKLCKVWFKLKIFLE